MRIKLKTGSLKSNIDFINQLKSKHSLNIKSLFNKYFIYLLEKNHSIINEKIIDFMEEINNNSTSLVPAAINKVPAYAAD